MIFQHSTTVMSRWFVAWIVLLLTAATIVSCNKATVNFGEEALTDDPNIIYLDSMTIDMATYQTDSFYTAGDTIFMTGAHVDSVLGTYTAKAYMQLGIPSSNNLKNCSNCIFDSLILIIRVYGSYGDTTKPFTLKVHRLTQPMLEDNSIGYNTSSFAYEPIPMGTATLSEARPSAKAAVSVALQQELGLQLFHMLQRHSDTVTRADKFIKFFKGVALEGSTAAQRSVYYFSNREAGSGALMRLYYRENSITPQSRFLDFDISPSTFQFNAFTYDKTGTALAAFVPKKRQVIPATQTGNRSFLHGNSGLFPHLNIPSLFAIRELHPYVKVVKAELEIRPPAYNYSGSLYTLPPALALYTVDADNRIGSAVYNTSGATQTGNLQIDYLYHKDTRYTYDLTEYVNTILDKGRSYQKALILVPAGRKYESRMLLDATGNSSSVQLKLYVLGL